MPAFLITPQKRQPFGCLFALLFAEAVLANSAQGADKIFRQIFPLGAGGYSVIRITQLLVVNISADITYILCHFYFSFLPSTPEYCPLYYSASCAAILSASSSS